MVESHGRTDAELVNIMSGRWGLGTAWADPDNRTSGWSASLGDRPAAEELSCNDAVEQETTERTEA